MNQNEFFNILMDGLKDFPESKLRDIISYYDNKFNHELALGKAEEEIVTELGNPNLIVNQYRSEFLYTVDNSELFTTDRVNTFTNTENFNDENSKYDFSSDTDVDTTTNDNTNITIVNDSITNNITDNIIDSNDIISNTTNNNIISTVSINSTKLITDNEILPTVDVSDDIANDSTINDTFNTEESILNIDNALEDIKINTPPYDDANSNNNFYNLYTSNLSTENKDANYENSNSNNSNYTHSNLNYRKPQSTVNIILKVCIVCVTLLIFSPVITGIITCIIGLFGVAISILVGSIGLLVGGTFTSLVGVPNLPMFVANFPYPVIVLFSLGSISLSLLLTLVFYYLCKFFIRLLIKFYSVLKSKGGDL